jgi:hypothetical protein
LRARREVSGGRDLDELRANFRELLQVQQQVVRERAVGMAEVVRSGE